MQTVDTAALECLVISLDAVRQAQAAIDRDGLVFTSASGVIHANPAVGARDRAMAEYRAWCARFGLTPTDRATLGAGHARKRTMELDVAERIGESPRARRLRSTVTSAPQ